MDLKKVTDILLDNVNLGGMAFSIIDDVLEEALKKVVADSSNPFDDMLMASVYPVLEKELKDLITEQINKLLADDTAPTEPATV